MGENEEVKPASLHDDADVVGALKKEVMNKKARDDQDSDGDSDTVGRREAGDAQEANQGMQDPRRVRDADSQGIQGDQYVQDAKGKEDTKDIRDLEGLPKSIQSDFDEAKACVDAKAPNAAAMMCRRVLSRLAISNGAKDDTTTGPQLDYLKNNHLIADDLYEAARMVKVLGDEGAHPPDEVTIEEAEAAFKVTQAILEAMNVGGKTDCKRH